MPSLAKSESPSLFSSQDMERGNSGAGLADSTAPDTEELAYFRKTWKEEIRERSQQAQKPLPGSSRGQTAQHSPTYTPRLKSALETYNLAVAEEQGGNHPEATRLYRNAFRLDSNVDKAYHHREELTHQRQSHRSSLSVSVATLSLGGTKASIPSQALSSTPTLASLLSSWPQSLLFSPDDQAIGVSINRLPDELIISILSILALTVDVNSIERFATVCRRARMLSLDTSVWRQLVHSAIVPSQLSDPTVTLGQLAKRYGSDYRRLFIEHPRLRLDGVYISICHYVRNGLGENPWVTISHLITYRRFLRFLPNGEVLSYRANEDQDIADVVRTLQPGFQRKDLCLGNWKLTGTRVLVQNLVCRMPAGHTGGNRYSFQMSLTLKSRPSLGRWNKLDFHGYESVNIETGETCPFPLRHERPYWFSKVKSYQ